jgi:hypothetical protein
MSSYLLVGPQNACTQYINGIIARHPDVQKVFRLSVPSANQFLSLEEFILFDKIIIVTRDSNSINLANYFNRGIKIDNNLAHKSFLHIDNEIKLLLLNGYDKKNIIYVSIESIILYKEMYIKKILKNLGLNLDNYDFKLEGKFTPLIDGVPTFFTVNLPIQNPSKRYINQYNKIVNKGIYLLIGPQHSCTRYITGIINRHPCINEIHHFSVPCGDNHYCSTVTHIVREKIIIVTRDISCINLSNLHEYNIDIKDNIGIKAAKHINKEINFLLENNYNKNNIVYVSIESIVLYKELYIKYIFKKLGLDLSNYDFNLKGNFTPTNNGKPTWFSVNLEIGNPNCKYIKKV